MKTVLDRIRKDLHLYRNGIILFLIYDIVVRVIFHAFCPMVILTGLPCPGCGMTRAAFFFITGQFSRSFHANPVVLPWMLFILYFLLERYLFGRKAKGLNFIVTILCIITITVYIYRMIVFFPSSPPMSYTRNNIMGEWIPGYSDLILKLGKLKNSFSFHNIKCG